MRIIINLLKGVFVIFLIVFSSCKYEDGPIISFRSAEKRAEGEYQISQFEVAGADSSAAISIYCF